MLKSTRNLPAGIGLIAVLILGAEAHGQANDVDCTQCVDTKDIAAEAVTTARIGKRAITTNRIENEAVTNTKLAQQAVTGGKIARRAVTTPKIKNGAVTIEKLSPELVDTLTRETVSFDGNFAMDRPESRQFSLLEGVTIITSECSRWIDFNSKLAGGNFNTLTFDGSENPGNPISCTDPAAVNQIADGLNDNESTSTVCDGNTWNTGNCGLGPELVLNGAVCLSCTDPSVRPCVGNTNWGGLGGDGCNAPSQSINVIFAQ